MNKEIEIPEGYEARIEGNKIILELKESEDEKIRSLLVWQVHRNIEDETNDLAKCVYDGIKGHDPDLEESIEDWKKCLAYLERLKERGPLSKDEEYTLARIIEYLEDNDCPSKWKDLLHDVYSLPYQKEQKPKMIQWTGNNLKEVIDLTGKSPRFEEWFKSWEEYENYVHAHNDILKLFCEDGSHYEVPVGAWIVKTPDGYNTPFRFRFIQKPAEWSEKDKLHLNNAILVAKKEWGVNSYTARWLEYLRDNCKKCNNHWKPSDEQMDAIQYVSNFDYGGHRKALESLYNDLKKL